LTAKHIGARSKGVGERLPSSAVASTGTTRAATPNWRGGSCLRELSFPNIHPESNRRRGASLQRNRIIAGLALAIVVVEARERSGALITADFALELGRDVFAVPGEITSGLSAGTNDLLRQGAAPLTSVRDVLDALGIEIEPSRAASSVSDAAAGVLEILGNGASGADQLTRASGLSSAEVAAALVELELAGLAAQADGVYRSFSPGRSRGARTPA